MAKVAKAKRKPNPAFMKPWQPDEALAAVVGKKPISRPDIIKRLWVYIKENDLQDKTNKRVILADELLKPLIGKKIEMLKLAGVISKHITAIK